MSPRFRLLQLALGLLACLLALGAIRELMTPRPLPPSPAPRAARPAATLAPTADPPPPGAYGAIATKNLFSPSRTEAPAAAAVAAGPKPTLHGVVMDGARSRAYLEDPAQRRTFGYLVGDPVGGGRVESIAADRVMIGRGDGTVEVLLRDPAKPRPPAPPAASATATAPVTARQSGSATTPASAVPAPAAASPATQPAGAASAPAARADR
jgi:hypothetical protein